MNLATHQLLKVIGSPFINFNCKISTYEIENLYRHARNNKIPLLYLESINNYKKLGSLGSEYEKLKRKYAKIEEAIHQISLKLNSWGISYAFFKSIKPYQEVTVDIDVLVFGSRYKDVIRKLKNSDYKFLGCGTLSATFRDKWAGVDFDIYNEVGVSRVIYLNKDLLESFVGERRLWNGEAVCALCPEADLLAVIAHSVLKEQMYVLSEYYTTLYYLANMRNDALNSFLYLVDKCKLRLAVETHLGITALLHKEVYGKLPLCLAKLIKMLKKNHLELLHGIEKGFTMPYKYHPITIVKAFLEKSREEKARRSIALQALNMCNPKFAFSVIDKTLYHIRRKTY
jgi:effector-binding domain-containing protein